MAIGSPRRPRSHPDRLLDCEEAISDAFNEMMENVIAAGWGPDEVALAVANLTDAHLKWREEKALTDHAVRQARKLI